jgi:hypothetical protein
MLPKRLAIVVCLAALFRSASPLLADDPAWTGGTITSPGNTVTAGSYIQISGSFTKLIYGPKADRVQIKLAPTRAGGRSRPCRPWSRRQDHSHPEHAT